MIERQRIEMAGQVQGVGFRPAVYRLARALGLTGTVWNDTRGVTIELQGPKERIDAFVTRLQSGPDKPPLAEIQSCRRANIEPRDGEAGFTIEKSASEGTALSQVTADIATCADCLAELKDARDFRYRYPFINCTNCGPRYSIVQTIPYDRPNTTMSAFEMCQRCAGQYGDVADRRFHAQPVACPQCGPTVWLTDGEGQTLQTGNDEAIAEAAKLLRAGRVVAIKGVGGFHLACDALNEEAVLRLRRRKRRDHKPFALMAASLETIRKHARVDRAAEAALTGPQSPIVLLPKRPGNAIAPAVAEGVRTFGFMLCYAPLHHLLFAEGLDVLVMTSANISDEPLICKNERALERLGDVTDAFLMHDREIYRQVDDSIMHIVAGGAALLRRARGYVPTPILMEISSPQDIFAAGPDMKNTFCFAKQNQLILSEHIGDLEDAGVYRHYVRSAEHLAGLFEVEPKVVACDMHPGYLSRRYASSLPGVRVIEVQHHWAHIASVMAEHGRSGPVIGLECDGTGYGTDGAIWGCECMIASLTQFERFAHLAYYPLAGGDRASKEAIRPALSLLKEAYGEEFSLEDLQWLLQRIEPDEKKLRFVLQQIEKRVNTVNTSSLGRVFDAVAACLGLGSYNHFDAQLPMALESVADADCADAYEFDLHDAGDGPLQLDLRRMLRGIVADVKRDVSPSIVSARFHNTLAEALLALAQKAREKTRLEVVALSGGVFCNRYLLDRLVALLEKESFTVLLNRAVPANDGGIALGQAAIAASLINLTC
ncbi:MAG: carbamoyltransferase HypF [Sedimentisphaerales bacterium]|nr:carbamoyltransferase HypF [Sedimentisphaerales bacterium]